MVHLDILFGDIQSYTASCIALMGARLMESFEYMCLLFGRDTDTVVLHLYDSHLSPVGGFRIGF